MRQLKVIWPEGIAHKARKPSSLFAPIERWFWSFRWALLGFRTSSCVPIRQSDDPVIVARACERAIRARRPA